MNEKTNKGAHRDSKGGRHDDSHQKFDRIGWHINRKCMVIYLALETQTPIVGQ